MMQGPSGIGGAAAAFSTSTMHTPLSDVVSRWCCSDDNNNNHNNNNSNSTILVLDSLESDGRFVLGTLVSSVLSDHSSTGSGSSHVPFRRGDHKKRSRRPMPRILWLNCTTMTDQLTLAALQKIGCPKSVTSTANLPESASASLEQSSVAHHQSAAALTMRSIPKLIRRSWSDAHHEKGNEMDMESIVKTLYRDVKRWTVAGQDRVNEEEEGVEKRHERDGRTWVILDDATTLAVLVGERLAYGFILSLRALSSSSSSNHGFGLAIRASNDYDIQRASIVEPRSTHWFGGATVGEGNDIDDECPWERQLVEMADIVVDVVPLSSGYSREVHGRLIFTSKAGPSSLQDVYNYCLTDTQALAIRIVR